MALLNENDLGMRGPQYDRTSFQGPSKPGPMPTPQAPGAMPNQAGVLDRGMRAVQGLGKAMSTPVNYDTARQAARDLRTGVAASPGAQQGLRAVGGAMKLYTASNALGEANDAITSAQQGDGAGAALSGLHSVADTASAGGGFGPVGLAGMALKGGLLAGGVIHRILPDSWNDTIGGTINAGLRRFGGGVDDSALLEQRAGLPSSAPSSMRSTPGSTPAPLPAPAVPMLAQPEQPALLGREVVGAPGIRRIDQPGKSPLYTNMTEGDPTKFSAMNVVPSDGLRGGAAAQPAPAAPMGGATVINPNYRDEVQAHNERFDREQMANKLDEAIRFAPLRGRAGAAGINALGEQLKASTQADAGLRTAGMREAGETSRAQARNAAELAANERSANVTMRGQDMTLAGHQMTAQNARALAKVEQFNKDRQYNLDVQKFGAQQAEQLAAQRSARENQIQKNIEAVNVGPDGKPDAKAAAEYRSGIDRSVARLGAGGVHELSPTDEQRLFAASDMLKTIRANASILPWDPDKLRTIDPVDLTNLRVLPNGDRQITRSDSKAAGQVIPRRFFETEQGVRMHAFGMGTPTNRYDILSEGK